MRHLSTGRYAAVASTLSLVVALGGASYAAVVVTGDQIKDNTVSTKDIRDNTVATRDIKDQTIEEADLSAAVRGALGGPAGSMIYVERVLAAYSSAGEFAPATCPPSSTPVTLFVPPDQSGPGQPLPAGINFGSNYMYLDLARNAIMVKVFANNPPDPSMVKVDLVCFVQEP